MSHCRDSKTSSHWDLSSDVLYDQSYHASKMKKGWCVNSGEVVTLLCFRLFCTLKFWWINISHQSFTYFFTPQNKPQSICVCVCVVKRWNIVIASLWNNCCFMRVVKRVNWYKTLAFIYVTNFWTLKLHFRVMYIQSINWFHCHRLAYKKWCAWHRWFSEPFALPWLW